MRTVSLDVPKSTMFIAFVIYVLICNTVLRALRNSFMNQCNKQLMDDTYEIVCDLKESRMCSPKVFDEILEEIKKINNGA